MMEENKTTQKGERAKSLKGSCLWGILLFAVLIFIDQLTKALAADGFHSHRQGMAGNPDRV